jgi:hypothetical protein
MTNDAEAANAIAGLYQFIKQSAASFGENPRRRSSICESCGPKSTLTCAAKRKGLDRSPGLSPVGETTNLVDSTALEAGRAGIE